MDDFSSSFNSSLRAAGMIQGIYLRGEQRRIDKQERMVTEQDRLIAGIEKMEGTDQLADMSDAGRQEVLNAMNMGDNQRPGGDTWFHKFVPQGGGVAAMVTTTAPDGTESTGPVTVNGTNKPDDSVVIMKSSRKIREDLQANYQRAKIRSTAKSANAAKAYQGRQDERDQAGFIQDIQDEATGGLNQQRSGAVNSVTSQTAPVDVSQKAPVVNMGIPQPPAETAEPAPAGSPRAAPVEDAVTTPAPAGGAGTFQPAEGFAPFKGAEFVDGIRAEADAIGLDPELAMAVSYHESDGGDPSARSPTGARGLFQITDQGAVQDVNKKYGTNYTIEDMENDPKANYAVGTRYLKMKLDEFDGDVEKALMAYNSGAGAVKRAAAGGEPVRQEGLDYPAQVMQHLSGGDQVPSPGTEDPSAQAPDLSARIKGSDKVSGHAARGAATRAKRREAKAQKEAAIEADPKTWEGRIKAAKSAHASDKQIEKIEAARDAALGTAAGTVAAEPDTSEEVNKAEEKAPQLETDADVKEAAAVVQTIKPAKKLSQKMVDALIGLNRISPNQMPLSSVIKAIETGRLTKKEASSFQKDSAGNIIEFTPEGGMINRGAGSDEAAVLNRTKALKAVQDYKFAQDKRGEEYRSSKLSENIKLRDYTESMTATLSPDATPEQKLVVQGRLDRTQSNYGLDFADKEAGTMFMDAARLEREMDEDSGSRWYKPWTWLEDDREHNDVGIGMSTVNSAKVGNPHNPASQDRDTRALATEWNEKNFLEPLADAGVETQNVGKAAWLAQHLQGELGVGHEEAVRQAGVIMQNPAHTGMTAAELVKKANSMARR